MKNRDMRHAPGNACTIPYGNAAALSQTKSLLPAHRKLCRVKTMARKTLTTDHGVPVADNQNTLTAGPRGPPLLQDVHLIENRR